MPNDEAKYYLSDLQDDVAQFLSAIGHEFKALDIEIECFKYGNEDQHRPYNATGKFVIKLFFEEDVIEKNVLNDLKK